jgi:hypothetical protein
MRTESKVTFALPKTLLEMGAFGFLYLNANQSLQPADGWAMTPERVISYAGILVATSFFAGQIWKDFKGSKSKLISDNDRLNRQQDEINALNLEIARLRWVESSHRRLRDKFYLLLGSLAPVLKDMDVDFSRKGTMGKIMSAIDDEEQSGDH